MGFFLRPTYPQPNLQQSQLHPSAYGVWHEWSFVEISEEVRVWFRFLGSEADLQEKRQKGHRET